MSAADYKRERKLRAIRITWLKEIQAEVWAIRDELAVLTALSFHPDQCRRLRALCERLEAIAGSRPGSS